MLFMQSFLFFPINYVHDLTSGHNQGWQFLPLWQAVHTGYEILSIDIRAGTVPLFYAPNNNTIKRSGTV